MKIKSISISDYDYPLPEERIAAFPLEQRDASKLLVWQRSDSSNLNSDALPISDSYFSSIGSWLPEGTLLVFNNTKVVRARLVMHKPSGARVEIFCLEPESPADYERAFAVTGSCTWKCMAGNSKKWKDGPLEIPFSLNGNNYTLQAFREDLHRNPAPEETHDESERNHDAPGTLPVRLEWDAPLTFGQLLEHLGRIPIPPYLGRDSDETDNTRYQTVYSRFEGSVAAPTAGLHFTTPLLEQLRVKGISTEEVTLHVGAGTFLPVKEEDATRHYMHTEHFSVTQANLRNLIDKEGHIAAVGTTTVRTIESLTVLGYRVLREGTPDEARAVGQWEAYDIPAPEEASSETAPHYSGKALLRALLEYMEQKGLEELKASTRIMIAPGYRFRVTNMLITNFHQPKSTLLLLVSAFTGGRWHEIYSHALQNGYRFLSYGDSSLLIP